MFQSDINEPKKADVLNLTILKQFNLKDKVVSYQTCYGQTITCDHEIKLTLKNGYEIRSFIGETHSVLLIDLQDGFNYKKTIHQNVAEEQTEQKNGFFCASFFGYRRKRQAKSITYEKIAVKDLSLPLCILTAAGFREITQMLPKGVNKIIRLREDQNFSQRKGEEISDEVCSRADFLS